MTHMFALFCSCGRQKIGFRITNLSSRAFGTLFFFLPKRNFRKRFLRKFFNNKKLFAFIQQFRLLVLSDYLPHYAAEYSEINELDEGEFYWQTGSLYENVIVIAFRHVHTENPGRAHV